MKRIAALIAAAVLTACSARMEAAAEAERAGLRPSIIDAPDFKLASWSRIAPPPNGLLSVYLEGDGLAWLSRNRPSSDPTPRDPTALALAARDPGAAVLYLARPCQFAGRADPRCHVRYWTDARFAPEVVSAALWAVLDAARRSGAAKVRLIGYSGGGVLAALTAARLKDVDVELITLAAPLDIHRWTAVLGVSPLSGSLSPRDDAAALRRIPQRHFAGGEDEIVPADLVRTWVADLAGDAADYRIIPNFDHSCCWPRLSPLDLTPPTRP